MNSTIETMTDREVSIYGCPLSQIREEYLRQFRAPGFISGSFIAISILSDAQEQLGFYEGGERVRQTINVAKAILAFGPEWEKEA